MSEAQSVCPACGAPSSGVFCGSCGQPMTPAACAHCGAALAEGNLFCAACGHRVGGQHRRRRPFVAVALIALVVVIGTVLLSQARSTPAPPTAATGGAVVPPDISQLSAPERFDRLYRRVMDASRTGDTLGPRLAPMALAAYDMLDSVNADIRYHAALIKLHLGDADGALALGDSIIAHDSTHLLGFVARGMALRWARDTARLSAVYSDFLRHAARELARGRPEYEEHATIIKDFQHSAEAEP